MSSISLLLAASVRHRKAGGQEALAHLTSLPIPEVADVLHDFDTSLALLRQHDASLTVNRAAEDVIHMLAGQAVEKLRQDPMANLSSAHMLGLEAIIRADGSRPSLLIREAEADADHPFARHWREHLVAARSKIGCIAAATARIQPEGGSRADYFGSCFLFNRTQGLVVTNRHVALAALRRAISTPVQMEIASLVSRYRLHGDVIEVEFVGELGSKRQLAVPVKEIILPPWPCTQTQATMDIAVLKLATANGELPDAVPILPSTAFENGAALASACTVGFPAAPRQRSGMVGNIDWGFVDKAIFGEQYGVKRLAPCTVQAAAHPQSPFAVLEFGHDATTLGGNSGSGLFAWLDGGAAFGLHFSGINAATNRAHRFSAPQTATLLEQLHIVDVPP